MHIALGVFKGQLGEDELKKVRMPDTIRAWLIVKKFYCTPLTNRSGCSGECEGCILNVKNRIQQMDFSTAAKPYALFTWSLKHVVQNVIDDARKKEIAPETLSLEDREEQGGVLDTLMEMFNE